MHTPAASSNWNITRQLFSAISTKKYNIFVRSTKDLDLWARFYAPSLTKNYHQPPSRKYRYKREMLSGTTVINCKTAATAAPIATQPAAPQRQFPVSENMPWKFWDLCAGCVRAPHITYYTYKRSPGMYLSTQSNDEKTKESTAKIKSHNGHDCLIKRLIVTIN